MHTILVLYFSRYGSTAALARQIARGVNTIDGCEAKLRQVPSVSPDTGNLAAVPAEGDPYVSKDDLREAAGLLMGSPVRFGNMAGALKHFLDTTGAEWISGTLVDKPFGLFTSGSSQHGGQESTLLSMSLPLLHHGMLMVGLPFTEAALTRTTSGGTPYGASCIVREQGEVALTDEETELARALGARVARVAASQASAS